MTYAAPPAPGGPEQLYPPLYGASIAQAFVRFWKKYVVFSGRASRSEFWWWMLIFYVVGLVLGGIGAGTSDYNPMDPATVSNFYTSAGGVLGSLWSLACLIPNLAIFWRRMHDTNRTGLWIFLGLIPVVGPIILIVFLAMPSRPEGARFDRV